MEAKYKIIGGNTIQIVTTDVEFTFEDGTVEVISIPHFNPESDSNIIEGIENRFVSEQEARNNKPEEDLENKEVSE